MAVGSSNQLSTGTYILHLRTLTEPGDTLATATAISPGSFHHSLSRDGSDDYYTFTLTETTYVWAAVAGGFLTDFDLLASDGTSLATTRGRIPYGFPPDRDDLAPVPGHFLQRELEAGSYHIKVDPASARTTLFFYTATDPGNSTAGAVQLSPFIPAAGHISANGDQDYFSITLDQTRYLYVEVVSAGERLPFEIAVSQDGSPVSFFTTPAASFQETNTAVITRVWGEFSSGTYYIKITAPEGTTGRYMVYPYIDRVYTDLVRTCTALTTAKSDPFYGCQWHLNNLEHVPGGAGQDINIEEAWAITQGEGAKVAFLDDGLDYSHEDLADNVITANNHDFSGADDPTRVFGPLEFHGTSVAGILAARDNTLGGRGVAPRASIYGYNVTSYLTDDSIARALNLHLDETTVANNSWGMQHAVEGPFPAPATWIAALRTGVEQGSNGKGISYVWGVGNAHPFVDANYDELTNYFAVTTVCGVNYKDERAAISELGANLWVCAPTKGIFSLATGIPQPGILTTSNGDRYVANFSGTSASAPIVSGVIALVRAANPNLTWRDAKLILANSARKNDAGNTGWQEGALKYGSTTDRYSFNHEYGFGVVDAGAAVTLAGTWTSLPDLLEYEVTSDDTALAIPDLESGSPPTAIESTVMLDPYVEFVEYVELNVDWDHASMRDLQIELESPSGAVSTIAPAHASPRGIPWRTRFRFGSSRHLGEDAAGTWTLRITDTLEGHGGSVRSWSLKVYGHGSVPGFPDITSTTPASNSITVAWSAPGIVGASDITAYDVRYIRSDAADKSDGEWTLTEDVWTATGGGDLEYTMSGLTGNVQYDVQVRAVNSEGDGLWSDVETGTPTTDKSPTIDSVTPGDRSITVEWTAPTNATLGTITSYGLRYIRSDASNKADGNWTGVSSIQTSGSLEYTLNPTATPLVNGASYDVQVRAVVGADQHPWSGARSATPRTRPGAPTIDSVTGVDGSLAVEWSRPLSNGGDDITSYDLRYIETSEDETVEANWTVEVGAWSSGDLEYDLMGLDDGTRYDVQVRAVNGAGEGAWSATHVGATRPGAPAIDSVSGLARGLTVGWSAPASDGDATVTSYDLRHIETSADETVEANWTVESAAWTSGDLTAMVTGLEVGTQYDVQVRAVNASGEGPWAATRMGTTTLSDDATLSALTLSGVRLTPTFMSGTTLYTPSVGYTVTRTTVSVTTSNVNATVEFLDGDDNTLGTGNTVQVDLSVGENTIKVEVTAQDGMETETYSVTVTRTAQDLSLTPPASDPVAPFASTATYTIRFRGWWTRAVTPDGLPSGAHFSRLIGAVHNAGVKDGEGFLESGETASGGIKSMAEFGGTSTLKGEVNLARNANPPTALSVLEGSTSFINPTATRTLSNRTLTTEFPLVTLTTMIAPSHDWFVGVSGLPLLDASGHWLRSHEVDLFPWDAGTEEGDDFSLNPSVTTQGGVITSIRGTGRFTTERIASLTFTLQSVRTARSLDENTPGGVDIGAPVVAVANSGTVGYTLGGTDAASFDLDGASGQLRTKSGVTYDHDTKSSYTVTVTATDTDGSIVTTVNIAVENINEPPAINGPAAVDFAEGGTGSVATFSLTDQDGDTVSWEALTGTDHDDFSFNNGVLTFVTTPNFEAPTDAAPPSNEYSVRLRASDGSNTTMHDVTVTVTNEEEPGMLGLSSEQPLIGTVLTATLTDPDGVLSESWSWERSPNQSSWSAITGQTTSSYTPVAADEDRYLRVTVEYTDGHGSGKRKQEATDERVQTPPVVNDPPLFPDTSTARSVPENSGTGAEVGSPVTATDTDRLGYTLTGGDTDRFTIDGPTGQIRVGRDTLLDFESGVSYSVTVTATDPSAATDSISVAITVTNVNEAPAAQPDTSTTDEDRAVTIDVLDNDSDPENDDLTVSLRNRPRNGSATVEADGTITYTPNADNHDDDTFSYRATDIGRLYDEATVTVIIDPVNDAPTFTAPATTRSVSESANPGKDVGAPVTATDVDENDTLTYRLFGTDARFFDIGRRSGQITVGAGVIFDIATKGTYTVMVEADDANGGRATVEVTITVTTKPIRPPIITGGGGGGGGPSGPSPSDVDFEWTVKHDIDALDAGHNMPTGMWSDGAALWIAENGDGADDAIYAYDLESGERVEEYEFELDEANRAPRGLWSDRTVIWVSDSGRNRLFAHDLESGERLPDRDLALAERNRDARGIWSDGETMWVLDGGKDSLFAYDLGSGDLLTEYALDATNGDPHGIWSDGVTIWVSDHGEKDLLAYRLPAIGAEGAPAEAKLERVRDEAFTELSKASNNSPRGIWSDGDVVYVADQSDDKVYTYNMPDAIDARLASLALSGVDIGGFSPNHEEYEGAAGEGVTETTVTAEAMQRRTDVAIDPPDADGDDTNGYQVALEGVEEITVTVTSADGSRRLVYRVRFPEARWDPARDPWRHCLRGAVSEGFSLVVYEGGSVEELVTCAESRDIVAFYILHEGVYLSYILGAPDFVNREFREFFPDGLPVMATLVVGSNGPPSADPFGDDLGDAGPQPWSYCLRGEVVEGFSLVVYKGGSVEDLAACAQNRNVTAVYALAEGEWVSYTLGAPEFVNQQFRELFAEGLPAVTSLVARSEGPPLAVVPT